MSDIMITEIVIATWQTIYMVLVSGILAALLGIILGTIIFVTRPSGILPQRSVYHTLEYSVNIGRSIPFIILLIAIVPFTRFLVGTSIGTNAALVPLTIGALPFYARMVENALNEVNYGVIEAGLAMGANAWQIIYKILLAESLPGLINAFTILLINLIGYSAMAGAIGGGGLGDLAVRYGYQRFDLKIMLLTVFILIIIVQLLQYIGDKIVRRLSHYK